MMPNNDLERKTESAIAARLKQLPALRKQRIRFTNEDSPKINQDLIVMAKRGEQNPPLSSIYNIEITVTLTMRQKKRVDTLPLFLSLRASMEHVFDVETYTLAAQLSQCIPSFHCYEIIVSGKDDSPEDGKHKTIWTLTAIAMAVSYTQAIELQKQRQQP